MILGTGSSDSILGTAGMDVIFGLGGDDELRGFEGQDNLFGGDGNDNLNGGDDDDFLFGGSGSDFLQGRDDNDLLVGGGGGDQLLGGAGDDTLSGEEGSDTFRFFAGDGNDLIIDFERGEDVINLRSFGFELLSEVTQTIVGNDVVMSFSDVTVTLAGEAANGPLTSFDFVDLFDLTATPGVHLKGTNGDERMSGSSVDDVITARAGDDEVIGREGDDYIGGMDGNDSLDGSEGDDMLMGNAGDDVLRGGIGEDAFRFFNNDGTDTIKDFTEGDDFIHIRSMGLANGFADVIITDDGTDSTVTFVGDSTTVIVENFVGLDIDDFFI